MSGELTLAKAQEIIASALASARESGYKPMACAVLDEGGHPVAFAREDGASMFRHDIAIAKAWGSIGMGISSRVLGQRAKENPNFFLSLATTSGGRFLPQTGGIVIKNSQGEVIGAVGASGGTGDEDELICIRGIETAGFSFG